MRILVTGSDGYIASGVIRELLSMGHEVVGIGFATNGIKHPAYEEHIESVFKLSANLIDEMKIDAVLHLAWRNGFRHNDPSHIEDLPGHYQFVRECAASGIGLFACMGTMHEVGYHEGAVDELTPCRPTTPYAIAKNALRELARGACEQAGKPFLWLRGFYLVSADGRGDSIFSKIVLASREGRGVFPFTSGRNEYDFLDYGDFCRLTAEAVVQTTVTGVVNVCSGVPESLGSRVERFIRESGLDIKLEYGAFPDRPYDSPAIWGDAGKIRAIDAACQKTVPFTRMVR